MTPRYPRQVAKRGRPDPPDTSDYSEFRPVLAGIAVWVLLLVLALVFRHDLETDGHGWWVWTAFAGIVEGGMGYLYLLRRAARIRARNAAGQVEPND